MHRRTGNGRRIFFEMRDPMGTKALHAVGVEGKDVRKLGKTEDALSDCSMDRRQMRAACVRQNAMMAPELAVLDVATGAVHTVTSLNPELRGVRLSSATRLQRTNEPATQRLATW